MTFDLERTLLLAAALAFGASAATAQTSGCATMADLATGIIVDYADGISETYRSIAPGVSSVDGRDGSLQIYRLEIAQGTHLLNYVEYYDGQADETTRQVYDYGMAPTSMPVPTDGGRFSPQVTVTWQGDARGEFQVQAYAAGDPLVLGACTYQTVDAVIAYETDDNYIESITYLPELGIGYLEWSGTDGNRGIENTVIGIRTGSGK